MPVIIPDKLPLLNSVTKYLLRRHKNRLLELPCIRQTSSLVGAIDYLLESEGKEAEHD